MEKLDCTGLNCPMPIVRLGQKIKTIETGQQLEVQADDPAFRADLDAWINKLGHKLVSFTKGEKLQIAVIEKT